MQKSDREKKPPRYSIDTHSRGEIAESVSSLLLAEHQQPEEEGETMPRCSPFRSAVRSLQPLIIILICITLAVLASLSLLASRHQFTKDGILKALSTLFHHLLRQSLMKR